MPRGYASVGCCLYLSGVRGGHEASAETLQCPAPFQALAAKDEHNAEAAQLDGYLEALELWHNLTMEEKAGLVQKIGLDKARAAHALLLVLSRLGRAAC